MAWPRQILSNSEDFLCDVIHPKVQSSYYDPSLLQSYQSDIIKAQQLQKYLYDLKNFSDTLARGENIFRDYEYDAFMQLYGHLPSVDGITLDKTNFLHQRSGINFEKQLVNIQKSLKALFENGGKNFTLDESINLSGQMSLGQAYTNVDLSPQIMASELVQKTLRTVGVKTQKYLTEQSRKASKNKDTREDKYLYIQNVNPKIDVYTDSVIVTEQMKFIAPNLANFAELYSHCKITAKNYLESSIKEYGVSLGKTNLFRVLTDFIPTLGVLDNQDLLLSFEYAIFTRRYGNFSGTADKEAIDQHFRHISGVYELMGVGQNIYSKYNDLSQLRDFLKQGADFLIVNVRNSDQIYVKSTREILVKMYQQMGLGSNSQRVQSLRVAYNNLT